MRIYNISSDNVGGVILKKYLRVFMLTILGIVSISNIAYAKDAFLASDRVKETVRLSGFPPTAMIISIVLLLLFAVISVVIYKNLYGGDK